jgi:hypothetical protein
MSMDICGMASTSKYHAIIFLGLLDRSKACRNMAMPNTNCLQLHAHILSRSVHFRTIPGHFRVSDFGVPRSRRLACGLRAFPLGLASFHLIPLFVHGHSTYICHLFII